MNKWDKHFLDLALLNAKMSKDPSTKVGAILVRDRHIIGSGFNGLPIGLSDTDERLNNREVKLKFVVHAEMNSVLAAAKFGIPTNGSTIYLCATNSSGEIWGGPPCHRCIVELIQAGIQKIVTYTPKKIPSHWEDSLELSKQIIHEVGIEYRVIEI